MGLAQYQIFAQETSGACCTTAMSRIGMPPRKPPSRPAVAAASLAIREGHEVHISVPDRSSGSQTALGRRIRTGSRHGSDVLLVGHVDRSRQGTTNCRVTKVSARHSCPAMFMMA